MEAALRAGVAAFDAGEYRAAARCWERAGAAATTDPDERLCRGLVTLARVAAGEAEKVAAGSAPLADLPATHRGVDVDAAREELARLRDRDCDGNGTGGTGGGDDEAPVDGADTEPDGDARPRLRYDGRRLPPGDLDPETLGIAAEAVAAVIEDDGGDDADVGYDPFADVVADAVRYERRAEGPGRSPFGALLADYVAGGERAMVRRRLRQHVARERRKDRDVEDLFD